MKKMLCDLMEVLDNEQMLHDSGANALEEIVLELFCGIRVKPSTLCLVNKRSATELHPSLSWHLDRVLFG